MGRFWKVLAGMAFAAAGASVLAQEGPTFNRDVAPIVFANCVSCHHPGGSGPFALTTFRDVKKRAKQIVKVTGSRYMPPWLPAPDHTEFEGARVLTAEEIGTLSKWAAAGAPEGKPEELKVKAEWKSDWQLGKPDLVVSMPEAYPLKAAGPDEYRNFVIPAVVPEDRYVVAYELRPEPAAAVHHAFLLLDRKKGARRLDKKDAPPGYPGMHAGPEVGAPQGEFASWQPGSTPLRRPPEMAWVLPKKADIVLQLHMRPTGKKEKVQMRIGFYFTDRAPVRQPQVLCLRSTAIDIPAGQKDYLIDGSYTLPVGGDILSILPHQHYLGKEVRAWADLPDGTQRDLLAIPQWDFNWQGAYRFKQPVSLPKGATLRMRYTYDNSKDNPRNPNQPPKRVRYGLESTDEMGEFWLQFFPRDAADDAVLARHFFLNAALPDKIARSKNLLERDPKDALTRAELGAAYLAAGKREEAAAEARQALADNPKTARAHHVLASIFVARNQVAEARAEYEAMVRIDPEDSEAQNNLGFLLLAEGRAKEAIGPLEKAVKLNPDDELAKRNLEKAQAAAGQ